MELEESYAVAYRQGYIDLLLKLVESGCTLSRRVSQEDLNKIIIQQAKKVFNTQALWVLLYDIKADRLNMALYDGPDIESFKDLSLELSESSSSKVFITHRPEIVLAGHNTASSPIIATFPLSAGGRKIGVVGFLSNNLGANGFSRAEIDFAGAIFADQVANALDNVKARSEREKVENELKSSLRSLVVLNEIGLDLVKDLDLSVIMRKIARYTAEILNADAAAINLGKMDGTGVDTAYFYNMPAGTEEHLLSKHAICGMVFERPHRVVVNDYPNSHWACKEFIGAGVSCMALVPVFSRGRVLATISAISFKDERHFNNDDLDELELVANQMAIAIDNAILYREQVENSKKIEAYADQLRMLNDFSQNIISESDKQKMADRLADSARLLIGCSAASVLLFRGSGVHAVSFSTDGTNNCGMDFEGNVDFSIHDGLYSDMYRTKRPIRLDDPTSHPRSQGAPNRHLSIRGLLGCPLLDSAGNFMGQIMVTDKKDGTAFSETDEELLVALCAQVAIGIEKAEAYEIEHSIADALQHAILALPDSLPGIEIGIIYESAGEVAKVGGDFYDLFEIGDGKIGILIGDVSGKGLEAATITSMVKSTIRAFAYKGLSPGKVLTEANQAICRQLGLNQFITMIYCVFEPRAERIIVSRAGHPEMIFWGADNCRFCGVESNMPLGVFEDVSYSENELSLASGDGVILYTDGLTEARRDKELLGEEGLIDELKSVVPGKNPQQVALELVNMAKAFAGGKPQDDIAVVVVRSL